MKLFTGLLMSALCSLSASAVSVGDTYEQVIAEKGQPATKLEMGDVLVLNYPGQRVKLKGRKVSEIKGAAPAASAPATPATPATSRPPAAKAEPAPEVSSVTWTTDYSAALASAHEKKAKVFLFFTGSDWCGWCKRLDAEILSTDRFKAYAGENLILVKLDFPRRTPQSDELKAQNRQLAQRYKIEGYPTVIVLNSAGKKVGELGYQEGGPGPFIDALKRL